jgi:hypothetical protein
MLKYRFSALDAKREKYNLEKSVHIPLRSSSPSLLLVLSNTCLAGTALIEVVIIVALN